MVIYSYRYLMHTLYAWGKMLICFINDPFDFSMQSICSQWGNIVYIFCTNIQKYVFMYVCIIWNFLKYAKTQGSSF